MQHVSNVIHSYNISHMPYRYQIWNLYQWLTIKAAQILLTLFSLLINYTEFYKDNTERHTSG